MTCCLVAVEKAELDSFVSGREDFFEFMTDEKNDQRVVDLDKSWQIIHYGLTGSEFDASTKLGMAIMGGEEFGEDSGYGPARYIGADLVKGISAELSKISKNGLNQLLRSKSKEMVDVYCFDPDDAETGIEYAVGYFGALVEAYRQASRAGQSMIVCLV